MILLSQDEARRVSSILFTVIKPFLISESMSLVYFSEPFDWIWINLSYTYVKPTAKGIEPISHMSRVLTPCHRAICTSAQVLNFLLDKDYEYYIVLKNITILSLDKILFIKNHQF